jgi:serine/threonine protein kinase
VAAPKKPANNAPVFGRWQGIRPIGRGGFGQTIEVQHLDNKKFAIVKIINADHFGDEYDDYVRRFKREMKILSEMDHPNICRLYEANFDSTSPWFAMERYKGNTVAEELDQYGPAPEKIWFDRARDILSALKYAHSKKIIHGDLNPGNVIIDGRGAKLIDFGIARRDGNYDSNSTKIFGANGWTSPEYGTLPPAIEDDIFVAASLLVKLGTGNHAFKANTVNNYLPSIISDEPDYKGLSTNQIQLLRRMHAKSRSERATASAALSLIDRLEPSAAVSRPIINKVNKPQVVKKAAAPVKKPDNFQKKIDLVNEAGDLAKIAFLKPSDLARDPRVLSGAGTALRYKGLTIWSILLGGVPLLAYWVVSKMKRTKDFGYEQKLPLANSALAYVFTFGIASPVATIWWGRKIGFKSLKLQLALQTFFSLFVLMGTIAEANQPPSGFLSGLRVIGIVIGIIGYRRVVNLLLKTGESPIADEPVDVTPPAPPKTKVEIREGEEGSQVVATQRTWEEVERFFVQALSSKRGKRFIFEIESDIYTDIYFQGYSEPDLSRTIEAAADLSVRPKLSDKQKLAMSVIGWDLPSEDLPNFIMFLESAESGDRSLAQIFTKTLREGYGLEIGTFSVIAPVR